MEEAPFDLHGQTDGAADAIVVARPVEATFGPWQLHRLVGEILEPLAGGSVWLPDAIRVVSRDEIYAGGGNDVLRYDGRAFAPVPISGAPPIEERYDFRWDMRPSTGEVFVVMTSRWETGVLLCRGTRASLACAPSGLPVAPSRVFATRARLYYQATDYQLYEILSDGRASLLYADVRDLAHAGTDRLLVTTASTSLVLGDDGTVEDLGPGSFHALGSQGVMVRLDVSSEFAERDCPPSISCGPGHGYTQFVLFRREGTSFVEHAHLDLVDLYADRAQLHLLPDGRVALSPNLAPSTYLAPALPVP